MNLFHNMRSLYESILDDEDELVDYDYESIMSKLRKLCDYEASYQHQQYEKDIKFIKPLCKKFWKARGKVSQCKSEYSLRFHKSSFYQATEVDIITKNKSAGGVNIYTFYCNHNRILIRDGWWSDSTMGIVDMSKSVYYEIPDKYSKEFERIIDNVKIKR